MHGGHPACPELFPQAAEIGAKKECRAAKGGEPRCCRPYGILISIKPDELPATHKPRTNSFRVSATSNGAINVDTAKIRDKKIEDIVAKDRFVI